VSLPYYGFQQVRLAIDHGDLAEGDYYRWFKQQRADADQLRGPSNAFSDLRHEIPQGWLTRVPEELYPSSYVRHFAEAFLEERAKAVDSRPFLLKCSFPDPHHPFTPPGRYAKMYSPQEVPLPITCGPAPVNAPQHLAWLHEQRRSGRANPNGHLAIAVSEAEARGAIALTYGMITMIDDMVGRIVDKLRQTGFFENTVVIFTSDHGDFMGNHGLILKAPLHYQSLIRVPFIWSDPMQQTLPARTRVMASTVDIAKTILERAGLSGYSGIQGNDLVEKLSRDVDENDGVLIEEDSQRVLFGFIAPPRLRTIVTARWRLSIYLGVAWGELYDLDCDPDELCNLWEDPACTEIRARLTEQLLRLMMSACDRSPLPLRLA
jgi:arylsulfatase A-like enzyme